MQTTSSIISSPPYELAIPHIEIRILCITGAKTSLRVPLTMTGSDLKFEAIQEFYHKNQLPEFVRYIKCDTNNLIELSNMFKLIRINKIHGIYDETITLSSSNVQNNETMLLIPIKQNFNKFFTNNLHKNGDVNGVVVAADVDIDDDDDDNNLSDIQNVPTQEDIEIASANVIQKKFIVPSIVNIDELVLQSDVQYDIRKLLISLANSCAYVIGAGPYATRLIFMLKQRLIRKKRQENDTQQCLIDMGFSKNKVQHALHINKYE